MTVVELAVDDLAATTDAYRRLLARDDSADEYATSNATLRFGRSQLGHRVLFDVADASSWQTLLERRGLEAHHRDAATIHVDGLPLGVTEYRKPRPHAALSAGDIRGIDHLVFQAAGRDHAVGLFGSTLGLDFRLDRHVDEGLRQLFFRADDLIVEVLVTPNGLEPTGHNLPARRSHCGGSLGRQPISKHHRRGWRVRGSRFRRFAPAANPIPGWQQCGLRLSPPGP